jgi:hypothetical protein
LILKLKDFISKLPSIILIITSRIMGEKYEEMSCISLLLIN